MTSAPTRTLMTAAELLALPDDGYRYELSRGELITMSPAGGESPPIASELHFLMRSFVKPERGRCGTGELGFRLAHDPDTVRAPDVWFIRADRYPDASQRKGFWPLAPDLAVEVLSDSDKTGEVLRKLDDYLQYGVTLIWIIDPATRRAWSFRAGRGVVVVLEDSALDGEDVLPGFRLPLRAVLP